MNLSIIIPHCTPFLCVCELGALRNWFMFEQVILLSNRRTQISIYIIHIACHLPICPYIHSYIRFVLSIWFCRLGSGVISIFEKFPGTLLKIECKRRSSIKSVRYEPIKNTWKFIDRLTKWKFFKLCTGTHGTWYINCVYASTFIYYCYYCLE